MQVLESYGDNTGYELITPTAATGFTASNLTDGNFNVDVAVISVKDNPIRMRMDGSDPTAAAGYYVPADTQWVIVGHENLSKFSCIDTNAGASEVTVLFFRSK
jgi:hypothetical protein